MNHAGPSSYSPLPYPLPEKSLRSRPSMAPKKGVSIRLISSYALDWAVLIATCAGSFILGRITPNKRPFSLTNPNISFPHEENETVPPYLLLICNSVIPIFVILFVSLVFVPGNTVPRGTPRALVWKRKLWELHIGWLGLALALTAAWIFTNGMKNLFGRPRPDLIARCMPDLDNAADYIVGGLADATNSGILVSGDICKNPDKALLDDGFRSFPSGHSSSAAAGLIYLSLFLASKFAVTIPFLSTSAVSEGPTAFAAFPSRMRQPSPAREEAPSGPADYDADPFVATGMSGNERIIEHHKAIVSARRQGAAPPILLLFITCLPFFTAIFIAASRWFNFRHHDFDILFGFFIGTVTSIFSFRYYHLPISTGAGWAWAPRNPEKAFWAGVGSYSYATPVIRSGDEEEAVENAGVHESMSSAHEAWNKNARQGRQ